MKTPTGRIDLENEHNVYICGAGFSCDAGPPLIADFLIRMRDSLNWLSQRGRKQEAEAVEAVLKFRLQAAAAAYWVKLDLENIEELFSLASASEEGQIDTWMRLAIGGTLDFARQTAPNRTFCFDLSGNSSLFVKPNSTNRAPTCPAWAQLPTPGVDAPRTLFKAKAYLFYLARLLGLFRDGKPQGKNTFITFNYDTVIEDALAALEVPFSYGWGHGKYSGNMAPTAFCAPPIYVLKLHGSVNWARDANDAASPLSLVEGKSYSDLVSKNLVPELLPPTWRKVFDQELRHVWDRAVDALRTATRVVVIGFSIPPTDIHFKFLLAAGLQKNISLRKILFVSPDAQQGLKPKAQALLRDAYIAKDLIKFENMFLDSFVRDNSWMDAIGRPGERGVSLIVQSVSEEPMQTPENTVQS